MLNPVSVSLPAQLPDVMIYIVGREKMFVSRHLPLVYISIPAKWRHSARALRSLGVTEYQPTDTEHQVQIDWTPEATKV